VTKIVIRRISSGKGAAAAAKVSTTAKTTGRLKDNRQDDATTMTAKRLMRRKLSFAAFKAVKIRPQIEESVMATHTMMCFFAANGAMTILMMGKQRKATLYWHL